MPQRKHVRLVSPPIIKGDNELSKDLSKYVTTKQAAEMLGVGQEHVRKLLGRSKVKGIHIGRDWLVFVPSLEKYVGTKSSKGRPPSGTPHIETTN
ncbi:MAG: helix-turn-helix domain-containing protein [Chloroflexi bacterium]|nr:helix-turn-helix domain-containing protein [Chloroflexota bacterium]